MEDFHELYFCYVCLQVKRYAIAINEVEIIRQHDQRVHQHLQEVGGH
jgi:hypothetical protein